MYTSVYIAFRLRRLERRIPERDWTCSNVYRVLYHQTVSNINRTRRERDLGARRYADDQQAFFAEYAAAHEKLSELGVTWPVSAEGEREE